MNVFSLRYNRRDASKNSRMIIIQTIKEKIKNNGESNHGYFLIKKKKKKKDLGSKMTFFYSLSNTKLISYKIYKKILVIYIYFYICYLFEHKKYFKEELNSC